MPTTTPPFRADMVGSLLRTAPLKAARAKREKALINPDQLKVLQPGFARLWNGMIAFIPAVSSIKGDDLFR